MNTDYISKFLQTSELYLRITEQQRSAMNMEEIVPLMFSENAIFSETFYVVTSKKPLQFNSCPR